MLKRLLVIGFVLVALLGKAQGILVFSADFEIDSSRYCNHSSFVNPPPKDSLVFQNYYPYAFWCLNTPDIFSPCDSFISTQGIPSLYRNNVPINLSGSQYPHSGNNYVGIFTYMKNPSDPQPVYAREYFGLRLASPLKINIVYRVEMYLNLGGWSYWNTPPPQIYFDTDSINYGLDLITNNDLSIFDYNNVVKLDTNIFTDTTNWVKISGYYPAKGGEKFMYVGNFYDDIETDTIRGVIQDNALGYAYFYIDDIALYELDSTFVGLPETEVNNKVNIYPNPAYSTLSVNIGNLQNADIALFDLSGRKLLQQQVITSSQTIDITALPAGMYVAVIYNGNTIIKREKVVVVR